MAGFIAQVFRQQKKRAPLTKGAAMFKRRQHVTITAQVNGEWSFRIKAEPGFAAGAFSDWPSIITASNDDDPQPSRQPVGFARTPAVDLGEAEADTMVCRA